jgi:serine/threonine protein kinase
MPPSLAVGQTVQSYRVVRQLGAGGMGAVYEVVHTQIGHKAALKVLAINANPEVVTRFLHEARAANQVQHPGIVRVFEFGQLPDGSPFMLMEFLEGETLSDRVRATPGRKLQVAEVLAIARQLASALVAVHAGRIVHRDLKPSNIILVEDPDVIGGERAKLLDFGIAKLLDDSLRQPGPGLDVRTETGRILGTPHYMAPEQCRSAGSVDAQADVYALGVILYQLLSGRLPFDYRPEQGESVWQVLAAKVFENPPELAVLEPTLPPDVAGLVMSMLRIIASDRPTMAQVEATVSRLLGIQPSKRSGFLPKSPLLPPGPSTTATADQEPDTAPTADAPPEAGAAVRSTLAATVDAPPGEPIGKPSAPSGKEELAAIPTAPMPVMNPSRGTEAKSTAVGAVSSGSAPAVPAATSSTSGASLVAAAAQPGVPVKASTPSQARTLAGLGLIAGLILIIAGLAVQIARSLPASPDDRHPTAPLDMAVSPAPPPTDLATPIADAAGPEGSAAATTHSTASAGTGQSGERPSSSRGSSRSCKPVTFEDDCTTMPKLSARQLQAVARAVAETGMKLCRGDSLHLSGFPLRPKVRFSAGPPRRDAQTQKNFANSLFALFTEAGEKLPSEIQIRCAE